MMVFKLCEFQVETEINGFDAFQNVIKETDKVDQMTSQTVYDLVVLDLNMPIMDGFDSCVSIRQLFEDKQELKLVQTHETYPMILRKQLLRKTPLMVAYTSDPLKQVENVCRKMGFDLIMRSIVVADITEQLIPKLVERRDKFQKLIKAEFAELS